MITVKPFSFRLSLNDNKIKTIYDIEQNQIISKFSQPLTGSKFKIYILKQDDKFLYFGTTKTSIRNRIRSGLNSNGKKGYHGYKWKGYKSVILHVFCFEDFDKTKIESVEAELAFIIRKSTGSWPEHQNEIHFNNKFVPTGQLIAEKIYSELKQMTKKNNR